MSSEDDANSSMAKLMSSILAKKPLSANDIKDLADAQKEIKRIRKLMSNFHSTQANLVKNQGLGGLKKGGRIALNEGEAIKDYVKRDIPKDDNIRKRIYEAIKPNVLFEMNSEDEIQELIDVFEPVKVEKGDVVIRQGEKGNTFYVVESGELSITVSMMSEEEKQNASSVHDVRVGFYGEGAAFGELALIYGSPRAATITAMDDCRLWRIKRAWYRGVVGQHRQRLHQEKIEFLPRVKVGDKNFGAVFSKGKLDTMAQLLKIEYFKKGSTILREGEEGDTFYMIKSGKVDIFKKELGEKPIATFGSQKFFGERALLSDDVRQATCVAATDVTCYVMTRGDFTRVLGSLQDILDGKVNVKKSRPSVVNKSKMTYKIEDLKLLRVLGEGAFGKVYLVKPKDSKEYYALKAQGKKFIVDNRQEEYVVHEYKLLKELSHPFIGMLHCAMQDPKYIYFLLDLLPGGELMDHLQSNGGFSEEWTRFYSASVVLAFSAMHEKRIAYRDLKPENMVLDAKGYCVLIDLGLAKKCEGPTYTFCGTPDYLAPEIIRGTGYDWCVDYWGLGILLYELRSGSAPFSSHDATGTAKKILTGRVQFNSRFSPVMQDLIRRFLTLDQSRRLGCLEGGAEDVIRHRFYNRFDWDGLLMKKIAPPFSPKLPKNIEHLGRSNSGKDNAKSSKWNPDLS